MGTLFREAPSSGHSYVWSVEQDRLDRESGGQVAAPVDFHIFFF